MTVNPASSSAAANAAEREVLVLKKQQDVVKEVAESLVELVKSVPAPGRIDTYA